MFVVLIMSSVFLVARISCYKHFLIRIIFFGFIGTRSAEDVKSDLWRKKELQGLESLNQERSSEKYFQHRNEQYSQIAEYRGALPRKRALCNKNIKCGYSLRAFSVVILPGHNLTNLII